MEIWLSLDDTKRLTGFSDRSLRRHALDGQVITRESDQPEVNGKRPREYALSSLPPVAQKAWFENEAALAKRGNPSGVDDVPLRYRDLVQQRFEIIRPLIEWSQSTRPAGLPARIETKNDLVIWIAAEHGISERKIWRLLKAWKRDNFAGISRDVREDKGKSRFFERHPLGAQFVLAKFAENLSIQLIYEATMREWPNIYNDGSKWPSYTTVRCYLESLPQAARDFVRLSKQQSDARNAPFVRTDIAAVPVNGTWVCDHRIYDVLVMNDCFVEHPLRSAVRLVHTAIIDMRSRVIVGSVVGTTGSSRSIVAALKQAAAEYGLPQAFYCDNGKDFRKVGVGAECAPELDEEGRIVLDPNAASVLSGLGIQVKYCIPKHPQSKMIESFFSTVSKRFDILFGDTYAGSKPALRPDACRDAEKAHHKWMLSKRESTPLMTASEFVTLAQFWIREYNETHEHTGNGMSGRSPLVVMNELCPPAQRYPVDTELLKEYFWETKRLTVANATVKFFENVYEGCDEIARQEMFHTNGQKLTIKYDPYDLARAKAFDEDGRLVADLVCQPLVSRSHTEDHAVAIMRERAGYRKNLRKSWAFITQEVPTEIDFLRHRARTSKHPAASVPQLASKEVPQLAAVNEQRPRGVLRIDRREIAREFLGGED